MNISNLPLRSPAWACFIICLCASGLISSAVQAQDSDGDGITNDADICPYTLGNERLGFVFPSSVARTEDGELDLGVAMTGSVGQIRPGDYNGDGLTDVAVTAYDTWYLFFAREDGSFYRIHPDPKDPERTEYIHSGDYNLDGIDDVAGHLGSPFEYPVRISPGDISEFIPDGVQVNLSDPDALDVITMSGVFHEYRPGRYRLEQEFSVENDAPSWGEVGVGDFNGDGFLDVFIPVLLDDFSLEESNRVYLGTPDGTFTLSDQRVGDEPSFGATAADFNGDGYTDVFVLNADGIHDVYFGTQSGEFVDSGQRLPGQSYWFSYPKSDVSVVDINHDALLDVAVGNVLYVNQGAGIFEVEESPCGNTVPVDFDGDGELERLEVRKFDIIVCEQGFVQQSKVFRGAQVVHRGMGTLQGHTSFAVADWNGDGLQDVWAVTAGVESPDVLYLATQDGEYIRHDDVPVVEGRMYDRGLPVLAGDFNGDGYADTLVSYVGGVETVYLGQEDGSFVGRDQSLLAVLGTYPNHAHRARVGDFNGDGRSDLVVSTSQGHTLFLANAQGDLVPASFPEIGLSNTFLVVGDLDFDGRDDLIVHDTENPVVVLYGSQEEGLISTGFTVAMAGSLTALGDINGDGFLDLLAADRVFWGLSNGRLLRPLGVRGLPSVPLLADADGDERADVFGALDVLRYQDGNVFSRLGTDSLGAQYGLDPEDGRVPTLVDMDLDGRLDVVHVIGSSVVVRKNALQDEFFTDTDQDGEGDCFDLCPNDAENIEGCVCTQQECMDLCPRDPLKTDPGVCGCGTPDEDRDGDGVFDCEDRCPDDPELTQPGMCGCGVAQTDRDGDGLEDCIDLCPDLHQPAVYARRDPSDELLSVPSIGFGAFHYPDSITAGDFDRDGADDILVRYGGSDGPSPTIYFGRVGGGTMNRETIRVYGYIPPNQHPTDPHYRSYPSCKNRIVGDVNGDLRPDVLTVCPNESIVRFQLPDRTIAEFGQSLAFAATGNAYDVRDMWSSITVADLNGDGSLDLLGPLSRSEYAIVWGSDSGVFTMSNISVPVPYASRNTAGDFNGDGWMDFAVLEGRDFYTPAQVWLNTGSNEWVLEDANIEYPERCMEMRSLDINRDGRDNLICIQEYRVTVHTLNRQNVWSETTPLEAGPFSSVDFGDFDGDGVMDIAFGVYMGGNTSKVAFGALIQTQDCTCPANTPDSDGDGVLDCAEACPEDPDKTEVGVCGCGVADVDADDDGALDCEDTCPNDPEKIQPGLCGCGVSDTDSNNDGVADCEDACPEDPEKIEPGVCGCGTSDTDSDEDDVPDCAEACPEDPDKTEVGVCGCGVADVDADDDGALDCEDTCPNDPEKIQPGLCGCGVSDTDSNNDGVADCEDACPEDPEKIEPGVCGCGTPDTDSDDDGVLDCLDACPEDPNKTEAGLCGCGILDLDSDEDGTVDCLDVCFEDPEKTEAGVCGCGTPDTDSDEDGVMNCLDGCILDPNKTEVGVCGCGTPDTDSDDDGAADCNDACPEDPNKIRVGVCGCGVSDVDSDSDGAPDCVDACPEDPSKAEVGLCGCGIADLDSDDDGTVDCFDGCPEDSGKTEAGVCGCGTPDTDSDDDGTADCLDGCPEDPAKTQSGVCGCGQEDRDDDNDGVADCEDNCLGFANPDQTDSNQDGVGDACQDADGDGVLDGEDNCPSVSNPSQDNADGDDQGDACDRDDDNDGIWDHIDRCPGADDRIDVDLDGVPDACDEDVSNPINDADGDGVEDAQDNCPSVSNPSQDDDDSDGIGDACDEEGPTTIPQPEGDDTGCSVHPTSDSNPSGFAWLMALGLGCVVWQRRRRSTF